MKKSLLKKITYYKRERELSETKHEKINKTKEEISVKMV